MPQLLGDDSHMTAMTTVKLTPNQLANAEAFIVGEDRPIKAVAKRILKWEGFLSLATAAQRNAVRKAANGLVPTDGRNRRSLSNAFVIAIGADHLTR